MSGETPKLRTLDDLSAAMAESTGGKCDRCRQRPAVFKLATVLRRPRAAGKTGAGEKAAGFDGMVCEPCGVDILAVVGRALGKVGGA